MNTQAFHQPYFFVIFAYLEFPFYTFISPGCATSDFFAIYHKNDALEKQGESRPDIGVIRFYFRLFPTCH